MSNSITEPGNPQPQAAVPPRGSAGKRPASTFPPPQQLGAALQQSEPAAETAPPSTQGGAVATPELATVLQALLLQLRLQQPASAEAVPVVPPAALLQVSQPQPAIAVPGAMGSLMVTLLNQRREAGSAFFLLVIPETAAPELQTFENVEGLIDAIRAKTGESVYMFCFLGQRMHITRGANQSLITPYGALSLALPQVAGDIVEDGWLGSELPVTEVSQLGSLISEEPGDEEEDQLGEEDYDEDSGGTQLF